MATVRRLNTQTIHELCDDWDVYFVQPGRVALPDELSPADMPGLKGVVPGTAASALSSAGRLPEQYGSLDDYDIWYSKQFSLDLSSFEDARVELSFEGLATIADVWLNGLHILRSENMFVAHRVDVTEKLAPSNLIVIRFSSLNSHLKIRRPKGRWRARKIDQNALRWVRTSLAGHVRGYTHTVKTVGPWRPIRLVVDRTIRVLSSDIRATVIGGVGRVQANIVLHADSTSLCQTELHVDEYNSALLLTVDDSTGEITLAGSVSIPDVSLWWPNTHGLSQLYLVCVKLLVGTSPVIIDYGNTGFRDLLAKTDGGNFALEVNATPTFMRGACWASIDPYRLTVSPDQYRSPLQLAAKAGINMLRVPGESYYESDSFYDACAQLGICIWQDFAFTLMDYPACDDAFQQSVAVEARQLLDRLQLNPALMILCGNTDVELQAAMIGLPRSAWRNDLFWDLLANISYSIRPDATYVPSTPGGGDLPIHVNSGVCSYFGVGPYMRPLSDLRRCGLRFAAECLALGNIPEDETIEAFLAEGDSPGPFPSWKKGVPREVELAVDADDYRDCYMQELMGEDPLHVRAHDRERYLALGRVICGEVLAAAMSEWRRPNSTCNGALVFTYRDSVPGAGWGIFDSFGRPKSSYYFLKRALAPVAVLLTDEGFNGLYIHIINDAQQDFRGLLRLGLYQQGKICVHNQKLEVVVPRQGALELSMDGLIGHFMDTTYAYRFGPPTHDITVVELRDVQDDTVVSTGFHFPAGRRFPQKDGIGVEATAQQDISGCWTLTIRTSQFAQAVHIRLRGYTPDDNYFHMEPDSTRRIMLEINPGTAGPPIGYVMPLNALEPTKIIIQQ